MNLDFKVGTLNVNGLANAEKRRLLLHFLQSAEVDVVALQEPHAKDKDFDFWTKIGLDKLCGHTTQLF